MGGGAIAQFFQQYIHYCLSHSPSITIFIVSHNTYLDFRFHFRHGVHVRLVVRRSAVVHRVRGPGAGAPSAQPRTLDDVDDDAPVLDVHDAIEDEIESKIDEKKTVGYLGGVNEGVVPRAGQVRV